MRGLNKLKKKNALGNSIILICLVFVTFYLQGQSPYFFNYQGVAYGADGSPIKEKNISLLISIVQGFEDGNIVFGEEHHITTTNTGLFSLKIGQGEQFIGNLRNIDWGTDQYFIRVEMDPDGGDNHTELGTTQLYSVPYALYAAKSGSGEGGSNQTLDFDGTFLSIENGNSVNLISLKDGVEDADADPANELQTISFNSSNNRLSLSDGGEVDLSSLDNDSGGGGGSDNQTLTLSGTVLSIENGNSVNLNVIQDGVEDQDPDPENEIQQLSLNGNNLSISGGNSISLNGLGTAGGGYWDLFDQEQLHTIFDWVSIGPDRDDPHFEFFVTGDNIGRIDLYNRSVNASLFQSSLDAEFGYYGFDDEFNLSHWIGKSGSSGIITLNRNASQIVEISSFATGEGYLELYGPSGNENIKLTSLASNPNNGFISAVNENGDNTARMFVDDEGHGVVNTEGPNGNNNVRLTSLAANNDHGYVAVYDAQGNAQAGFYVDTQGRGVVFGDLKTFRIPHPDNVSKNIIYSSLEGPEVGVYLRGTGTLKNGEADVKFPDYFSSLISQEQMTITLTPLSAESKGMAVVEKNIKGIRIKELWNGSGNYSFDWEVKAIRKGFEDFQIERDKIYERETTSGDEPKISTSKKRVYPARSNNKR
jgi:hypothetical protein